MITLGGSAFKPYYRPSLSASTSGEGISPTDNMSPLSILTDLLSAGLLPADLQATFAAANLPSAESVTAVPSSTTSCLLPVVPDGTAAGGKAKRKRTTFTASQASYLEKEYDSDQYMPRSRRIAVAESLQLSENQIKTWFQNRRAKDKKIRTMNTSTTLFLPSSSPMLSPAPSASSSSSSPSLSATQHQQQPVQPPSDTMPSLIELLALGKTDLLPLLNSQLLTISNAIHESSSSSQ